MNSLPSSLHFFGVTFHLYGLLIGVAIWVGLSLVELKMRQLNFFAEKKKQNFYWWLAGSALVGAGVGARAWHVMSDWQWYFPNHLQDIFLIWQGGLSILGAILGGVVGLWAVLSIVNRQLARWQDLVFWLDLAVFGLPVAQAIGRIGNGINQELYGLPTKLPWAIHINPEFRLEGLSTYSTFHPLFAYEALAMLGFAALVWWFTVAKVGQNQNHKNSGSDFWAVGTGHFFLALSVVLLEPTVWTRVLES